jgi:hypothetical protein
LSLFRVEIDKSFKPVTFAAGNNGIVYVAEDKQLKLAYEAGVNYSCLLILKGMRALIGATMEPGKPGILQVVSYYAQTHTMELTEQVQVHTKDVRKMCLNFDNTALFTVSDDGCLAYISLVDRDPRRKDLQLASIVFTKETMYLKQEREILLKAISSMKAERESISFRRNNDNNSKLKVKFEQILKL